MATWSGIFSYSASSFSRKRQFNSVTRGNGKCYTSNSLQCTYLNEFNNTSTIILSCFANHNSFSIHSAQYYLFEECYQYNSSILLIQFHLKQFQKTSVSLQCSIHAGFSWNAEATWEASFSLPAMDFFIVCRVDKWIPHWGRMTWPYDCMPSCGSIGLFVSQGMQWGWMKKCQPCSCQDTPTFLRPYSIDTHLI